MEASEPFLRDIDQIIAAVKEQIPEITVWQWHKKHPSDDDGIWWFGLLGIAQDMQLENAVGMCPFLIETDECSSHQNRRTQTIEETVQVIVAYLTPLR